MATSQAGSDHELQQLLTVGPQSSTSPPGLQQNRGDSPKDKRSHVNVRTMSDNSSSLRYSASLPPDPQDVSYSEHKNQENSHRPGWTAFYLRKGTLLGFIAGYILLLAVLVGLAIGDSKHHGLASAQDSEHYLWTYGPTAVLAIVAALFGQVEHRIKQAIPWKMLQDGPVDASSALLLDYTTPTQPVALYRSIRSAHWPVTTAVAASLLIKLLTVVSTGLLMLQNTVLTNDHCQLAIADDFVSTFNASVVGSSPALAAIAIQNNSIPCPPGTTRNMAFQTINVTESFSSPQDFNFERPVKALYAGLDCELGTMSSNGTFCADRQCHGPAVYLNIDSPSCRVSNLTYGTGCGEVTPGSTCTLGDIFPVQCDSSDSNNNVTRLVIAVERVYENISAYSYEINILPNETTALLCVPRYNISDVIVRVDANGNFLNASSGLTMDKSSPKFSGWDLLSGIRTSSEAAGLALNQIYAYSSTATGSWYTMWPLVEAWANNTYTLEDLRDPTTLQKASNDFFAMASAQMVKHDLMTIASDSVIGTCYTVQPRLRVRGLPLYLMAGMLTVLILLTVVLLFLAPRDVTSRDPGSIGGLALILAQSPSLLHRLSAEGSSSIEGIRSRLFGHPARSVVTNTGGEAGFTVQVSPQNDKLGLAPDTEHAKTLSTTWWRPFALRPVYKGTVIALLLLLIAILETTYWQSRRHDGLVQIDPQSYSRFGWVYIPAAIMLAAQLLVGSIAFSSIVIFPFYLLRTRASNTRADLLRDYVSKTAIESVWCSVVSRHVPIMFIALAMLLTPLLTIVVSGLYTPGHAANHLDATLATVGQFNASFIDGDIGDLDGWDRASLNIGLLLTQNFSFPAWTYDELAFPELQVQNLALTNHSSENSAMTISAIIPAIRGNLTCTTIPNNPNNFSALVNFTDFQDAGCSKDGIWPDPGQSAFGYFDLGTYDTHHPSPTETTGTPFNNVFCGAYGTNGTNWRAFTCTSTINTLDVYTTLTYPSLSIQSATPDESSSRLFTNLSFATYWMSAYPSTMIPSIYGSANFEGPTTSFYDPTFQAIVYGIDPVTDPNSFPILPFMNDAGFVRLVAQLQRVYRTVISQTANTIIRIPFDPSSPLAPSPSYDATFYDPSVYRLRQSVISTRILDVLLFAIALCVILSSLSMNTSTRRRHQILPKDPTSIAAGASLIAGAEMLKPGVVPDPVTAWSSDAELQSKGVWDGMLFSLGWWGVATNKVNGNGEVLASKRFGLDVGRAEWE